MPLQTLVLIALASRGIVDVWRNGSIFAGVRARLEVGSGFLVELLRCSYCLLCWVPFVLGALSAPPTDYQTTVSLIVSAAAVVGIVQFVELMLPSCWKIERAKSWD